MIGSLVAFPQRVRTDRAAAHRKHGSWRAQKRLGSRLGEATRKTSSPHNRFRFIFYQLHSGSSGQHGLVESRLGQDSDENLHFDRRKDERKED